MVSVVYADIAGMDRIKPLDSGEYAEIASELIRQFDAASTEFDIERVRPVHNGYLGSYGLTVPRLDSVRHTVDFALECAPDHRAVQRRVESESEPAGRHRHRPGQRPVCWVERADLRHVGPCSEPRSPDQDHRAQTGIFVSSRVYDVLADTMTFTPAGSIDVNGVSEPIWRLEDSQ